MRSAVFIADMPKGQRLSFERTEDLAIVMLSVAGATPKYIGAILPIGGVLRFIPSTGKDYTLGPVSMGVITSYMENPPAIDNEEA